MLKLLRKIKNLGGVYNYHCPKCGHNQLLSKKIVYDFTEGKHSHPGGETFFPCPKCGEFLEQEK